MSRLISRLMTNQTVKKPENRRTFLNGRVQHNLDESVLISIAKLKVHSENLHSDDNYI